MKLFYYCLFVIVISGMFGCGSTPYRDDYAQHQNTLKASDKQLNFTYAFADGTDLDIRGSYQPVSNIGSSNMMYAGDAGLIGLIAQIGIHSAAVSSARENQLSGQQRVANEHITDLILLGQKLSLNDLLGDFQPLVSNEALAAKDVVQIKPIFFSNPRKTKLYMRMIAWIPKTSKNKRKKAEFVYRNSFEVFLNKISDDDAQRLVMGDAAFLQEQLSSLLQMGMYMLIHDVNGEFAQRLKTNKTKAQTFLVGADDPKAVRGKLVEERCDYQIVKDLRSWLIALPVQADTETSATEVLVKTEPQDLEIQAEKLVKQCNFS